jgi:hypothetical protein
MVSRSINLLELLAVLSGSSKVSSFSAVHGHAGSARQHRGNLMSTSRGTLVTAIVDRTLCLLLSVGSPQVFMCRVFSAPVACPGGQLVLQVSSYYGVVPLSSSSSASLALVASSLGSSACHQPLCPASRWQSLCRSGDLGALCSVSAREGRNGYAYPPTALLLAVLPQGAGPQCPVLLVTPLWSPMWWFRRLLALLVSISLSLPVKRHLLRQFRNNKFHPQPDSLQLLAWWL